jgi:hypothetical protein
MYHNQLNAQTRFPTCITSRDLQANRALIKERNRHIPLHLESVRTGMMTVSQRLLRDTYPAILGDMRSSGNRRFNPIQRASPNSPEEYDQLSFAMELLRSTLERKPCLTPLCPQFGRDPIILDPLVKRLEAAVWSGDPIAYHDEVERTLGLLDAFNRLTKSRGVNDSLCPRYPTSQKRSGLGPGIQLLMRDVGLRLMPSMAAGGGDMLGMSRGDMIYTYISIIDRLMGNSTGCVRRLVEDLRVDEQDELLNVAFWLANVHDDALAWKIQRIIQGQPADPDEVKAQLRQVGTI